jgi:hypothetical protein
MPVPQLKDLYGQNGELGIAKLSMIDNSNAAVQRRREPPPGIFTVTIEQETLRSCLKMYVQLYDDYMSTTGNQFLISLETVFPNQNRDRIQELLYKAWRAVQTDCHEVKSSTGPHLIMATDAEVRGYLIKLELPKQTLSDKHDPLTICTKVGCKGTNNQQRLREQNKKMKADPEHLAPPRSSSQEEEILDMNGGRRR